MLLRSIIIDDESKGIDALKILIENFVEDVTVVATTTKAREAVELIESYRPEIVFLDINMPEMDGFELLEKLKHKNFCLVFTTAHEEYALRALKNDAFDYLLKPVDFEELRGTIQKIKRQLSSPESEFLALDYPRLIESIQQKNKLLIHTKTGIESINISDILWLESRSNYTNIYLYGSKNILTTKTLKELEGQLCTENSNFIRVHNSFIINLNKVQRFIRGEDVIIMAGEQKVPLSKSRKQDFFKWLNG